MTSNKHNLYYDETVMDIERLKYRKGEFSADLKDMINEYLEKLVGYGYKNCLTHEMTDRLLMIQEEKGERHAIRYFKWRIEGSITREQYFSAAETEQKEDREQKLMQELSDIKEQLAQMQTLIINIAASTNNELLQRRLKVV